jgi:hypothetical protein
MPGCIESNAAFSRSSHRKSVLRVTSDRVLTYIVHNPRGLVQREMERGRAPLASIAPIPRGQFAPS